MWVTDARIDDFPDSENFVRALLKFPDGMCFGTP